VSKIGVQVPWENIPGDTRLMIIQLRKYNPAEELLIGLTNAGHGDRSSIGTWSREYL